jgi:DNA invertase Pin-like site-specific DNA recombinase
METAVLYARISEDPLGLEKGVVRQLDDCRALAAQRDWRVVAEYQDNDVSALRGRPRPRYGAMMRAVENGQASRIVVYMTSRLWRNRRERAEAIERLARARLSIVAVKGPDLDLASAAGRMLAGVLGEMDTHESEVKGERVARAALERAQEGRANGAVLYGWRREHEFDDRGHVRGFRDVVDPQEAAVVREVVDRLLAGESLKEIVVDLNERGVASPNGHAWRSSGVRKVALRPANVGLRVHGGQIVSRAAWPAIVDEDKHARVVALLNDPSRRTVRSGRRRHLLSYGIGECGVCGGELRVATVGGNRLYVCDTNAGCVGRRQERVDAVVDAVMIERLSRPDARDLFVGDDDSAGDARSQRDTLQARLDTAADDYASGEITAAQLRRITATIRPQLDELDQQIAAALRGLDPDAFVSLIGEPAREGWRALTITQRRAVLEALRLQVKILPTRRGPGFDPSSVRFEWNEEPVGAG